MGKDKDKHKSRGKTHSEETIEIVSTTGFPPGAIDGGFAKIIRGNDTLESFAIVEGIPVITIPGTTTAVYTITGLVKFDRKLKRPPTITTGIESSGGQIFVNSPPFPPGTGGILNAITAVVDKVDQFGFELRVHLNITASSLTLARTFAKQVLVPTAPGSYGARFNYHAIVADDECKHEF